MHKFTCLLLVAAGTHAAGLVGSDKCTWGPSYYCANETNMKKCGVNPADCTRKNEENNDMIEPMATDMPGSNKCTWGPSYWCESKMNAKECNVDVKECAKYCDAADEYPAIQEGDVCSKN